MRRSIEVKPTDLTSSWPIPADVLKQTHDGRNAGASLKAKRERPQHASTRGGPAGGGRRSIRGLAGGIGKANPITMRPTTANRATAPSTQGVMLLAASF